MVSAEASIKAQLRDLSAPRLNSMVKGHQSLWTVRLPAR